MKYNIVLKTEKHFSYIVEANNIDDAVERAKDAAAWYDFSNPECFDTVTDQCREATESDVANTREEFFLEA